MKAVISRFRSHLATRWKPFAAFGGIFAGAALLLLWRLGGLVGGYSSNEQAALAASNSVHTIWSTLFNAPYYCLVHVLTYITPHDLLATRLASALVAWVGLVLFCVLAYRWFGTRAALIGTVLFGASNWFLHVGRLGVPQVMFLGVIAMVACGVWIREKRAGLAVILGLTLAGGLLYTPGMVWFVALGLLWQWKHIDAAFKQHLGSVTIGALIFLAALVPLGWRFYHTPSLIKIWLQLPETWSHPFHFLHNLANIPLAFFVRSPVNPEQWLGNLAILDIFNVIMFALGAYIFCKYFKLARVRLVLSLAVVGSIVIAITGTVPLTALVPFAFMVVTAGADYILEVWLHIFPRNPLARWLGIGLFSLVVGMACLYNIRAYFVAWPQATATRDVFIVHD
jgi:4-amino-4-deoxy-L-arabinose transferase-like glycosyltransferase